MKPLTPPRSTRASAAVEFAICALLLVSMVVGFTEFGRLIWTTEVLQETASEAARCMGMRAASCAAGGVYSQGNSTDYIVTLAGNRGVTVDAATITLNNAASCGGASGFSRVTINYRFVTVAPALLTTLGAAFAVPATACFPNNS